MTSADGDPDGRRGPHEEPVDGGKREKDLEEKKEIRTIEHIFR